MSAGITAGFGEAAIGRPIGPDVATSYIRHASGAGKYQRTGEGREWAVVEELLMSSVLELFTITRDQIRKSRRRCQDPAVAHWRQQPHLTRALGCSLSTGPTLRRPHSIYTFHHESHTDIARRRRQGAVRLTHHNTAQGARNADVPQLPQARLVPSRRMVLAAWELEAEHVGSRRRRHWNCCNGLELECREGVQE